MQAPIDIGKLVQIVTEKVQPRHALPRVVFVVGPTSSGKTALGIRLAKEFGGEIVNADARQIYRDLTIGTGKPPGKRTKWKGHTTYLVGGVPHFLMDFLPPDKTYSAAQWREAALRAVKGMVKRGALPIVVGGTGLYISSLIDNYHFPAVAAQPALRTAYEQKPLDELVRLLLTIDPGAAGVVDLKNKRRVVRALEVVTYTGKKFSELRTQGEPLVDAFQVGIRFEKDELFRRIDRSIDNMVDEGLIDEVRDLLRRGYKASLPSLSAIGYQDVARYLNGEITQDEAIAFIKRRTHLVFYGLHVWRIRQQVCHADHRIPSQATRHNTVPICHVRINVQREAMPGDALRVDLHADRRDLCRLLSVLRPAARTARRHIRSDPNARQPRSLPARQPKMSERRDQRLFQFPDVSNIIGLRYSHFIRCTSPSPCMRGHFGLSGLHRGPAKWQQWITDQLPWSMVRHIAAAIYPMHRDAALLQLPLSQ